MDKRPPLLFWDVDTQVDFMLPDGKLYVDGAEAVIPNLGRLTEAARHNDIPMVASADDHRPSDAELSDDPDFEETYPPHCLHGTEGQRKIRQTRREELVEIPQEPLATDDLVARLASAPGVLILKDRFDVFTNPNTERLLDLLEPQYVVLYGVALDVCVFHALEGLWERGYRDLTVVRDATAAIQDERGETLLADWEARGVEMVTTDELVERLETRALTI